MPKTAESKRNLYQEVLDLPENMVGEIIDGELHTQPRPAPRHSLAASNLGTDIVFSYHKGRGGPGGWWILFEPEIHLDKQVVVPDIAGWKKDCLPQLPETAFFELAPDWVCEVLSPSTARKDRILKLPLYTEHGVGHAWLIDPVLKTLEAYQLEDRFWKLIGAFSEKDVVSIYPFEEIAIELTLLWVE